MFIELPEFLDNITELILSDISPVRKGPLGVWRWNIALITKKGLIHNCELLYFTDSPVTMCWNIDVPIHPDDINTENITGMILKL